MRRISTLATNFRNVNPQHCKHNIYVARGESVDQRFIDRQLMGEGVYRRMLLPPRRHFNVDAVNFLLKEKKITQRDSSKQLHSNSPRTCRFSCKSLRPGVTTNSIFFLYPSFIVRRVLLYRQRVERVRSLVGFQCARCCHASYICAKKISILYPGLHE